MRAQEFIKEAKQATAREVLKYINRTHHEPFQPGEKMHAAVMAHPHWQLQRVPLLNLNIPDQEYDDVDYDDNPPESDPYDRVMTVDPGHAGEISLHLVDRYPIVIDSDRYIIDGNHRAWAAKYLLNRDYIQAWVPVKTKQTVAEARIPRAIEEFLDSLSPDDVGVEEFGPYRVHFEGFTDDCKSSKDYCRDPEAVYQQVYNDFIQREGGARPLVQDMVGDEDYPILYSIFRIKKQPMRESLDQPYPLTWEKSEADDSMDALARLPDGSNLSIMFNQDLDDEGQGIYSVEFWRGNSQEVTGTGDAQRVFATVLAAIAQFIEKRRPEQLYFSANKDVEPGQKAGSRSNLYTSLVRRYASALGYEADVSDFAGSTSYKLYRLNEHGVAENFADGKVKGRSRPGRVKRAGASCAGSVTSLRAKAKKYGGERGKMYHWCANMKSGRKKANESTDDPMLALDPWTFDQSDQGWRTLPMSRAIAAIKDYLGRYVRQGQFVNAPQGNKRLNPSTLYWHLGQLLAMSGAYNQAVSAMRSSLGTDADWNDYVRATIAFLANNKRQFDQYVGRDNSNKATIDRLSTNWGRPYKDAY